MTFCPVPPTPNQPRMYPSSPFVCIYKYTQTHQAVFVFSLKWDHTIHIALQLVFHLLFLGPLPMPIHINQQAYTYTHTHTHLLYIVQVYRHPLNHSFIDRNLSFIQFSLLDTMLPWKAFYINLVHKVNSIHRHILRSEIARGTYLKFWNLPICPIYQFIPTNSV